MNETPDEIMLRYQLLNRAIEANVTDMQQTIALNELNKLVRNELVTLTNDFTPNGFTKIYFELEEDIKRFRELCAYPKISEKMLIAFGGGFSAGKSTLINALLGERVLLASTHPTTAIPTYIFKSEQVSYSALNMHQQKISLSEKEFSILTHNEESIYQSHLAKLLETVFVTRPSFIWDNLAFIDTPGYSKPDDNNWTLRTDEQVAKTQLNIANAIVWVMSVEAGNITEEDLEFLSALNHDIPKVIVVTRCDKATADEVERVIQLVKNTLITRNIVVVDVLPVSSRSRAEYGIAPLVTQINRWNAMPTIQGLIHNIKTKLAMIKQQLIDKKQQHLNELYHFKHAVANIENAQNATELIMFVEIANAKLIETSKLSNDFSELEGKILHQLKMICDMLHMTLPEFRSSDEILGAQSKLVALLKTMLNRQSNELSTQVLLSYMKLNQPIQTSQLESLLFLEKQKNSEQLLNQLDGEVDKAQLDKLFGLEKRVHYKALLSPLAI